jgi:HAD-superfamily hydrolase, subfamily IIB
MEIKVIVMDIDGTLVGNNKTITERTKQALINSQKKGIKLVLASGRPTAGMIGFAKTLEMDKYDGLLISFNGSRVSDLNGNILYDKPLSVDNSKAVLEHLKKFDVIPMITKDEYLYVNDVFAGMMDFGGKQSSIIQYESRSNNYLLCEKKDLAAFVDYPLSKILVAGNPEYLRRNFEAIYEPFKETLSGVFSAPVYFEFTEKNIDKAEALNAVLNPIGIDLRMLFHLVMDITIKALLNMQAME